MKRRYTLLILLGAASLIAGAVLADLIIDDTETTVPMPRSALLVPDSGTAGADDPGAVLAPVAVAVRDPLFEEATEIYPTVYDDEGAPGTDEPVAASEAGGSASQDDGASQGGGAPPPADSEAASGAADETMATIIRFLDFCAEETAACPFGVGATVLFGGDAPLPPPMRVEVVPEAITALFPTLRCGPMWPTLDTIPVVLLSNRPFDTLHVALYDSAGRLLSQVLNQRSDPREFALYDQRLNGWQGTEATEKAGVHTCLQLPIDALVPQTPDRQGSFELRMVGFHGSASWEDTVKFSGHRIGLQPPTRIMPVDANRAFVVVSQQPDDVALAWVYAESESGRHTANGPIACENPPAQVDSRATRVNPSAVPKSFAQTDLDSTGWPWDRSFSQYTIWSLHLRHSESYTLCINLVQEGRTEQWALETPNGVVLDVASGELLHNETVGKGSLLVHLSGAENCSVANPQPYPSMEVPFPQSSLLGSGTDTSIRFAPMCHSGNGFVGPEIELRALLTDGGSEVFGIVTVPTAALATQCGRNLAVEGPPCDTTLEWRTHRVLCGGGLFAPDCGGNVTYSLGLHFTAYVDTSSGRPDPRDWGIFSVSRLGGQPDTIPTP